MAIIKIRDKHGIVHEIASIKWNGLPNVTSADNEKILKVVDGKWTVVKSNITKD